ncbi:MAG: beta-propeller fold lactonase family protein [Planctomycetales bacterium]|nr:beta-propeller fold lactonase family protein [Planctomycetales bacterium]
MDGNSPGASARFQDIKAAKERISGAAANDYLEGVSHLAYSPDGRHLYVTSGPDHAITLFGGVLSTRTITSGHRALEHLFYPQDILINHSGGTVYVADTERKSVIVFHRSSDTGDLTFLQEVKFEATFRKMALTPDSRHLYVMTYKSMNGYHAGALTLYACDKDSGELTFQHTVKDEVYSDGVVHPEYRGLLSSMSMCISNDGRNLYVGEEDARVRVWERDVATGRLTYWNVVHLGDSDTPRKSVACFATDKDNRYLWAITRNDPAVILLKRFNSRGMLMVERDWPRSKELPGIAAAYDAITSSDGRQLYLTTYWAALTALDIIRPEDFANEAGEGKESSIGSNR